MPINKNINNEGFGNQVWFVSPGTLPESFVNHKSFVNQKSFVGPSLSGPKSGGYHIGECDCDRGSLRVYFWSSMWELIGSSHKKWLYPQPPEDLCCTSSSGQPWEHVLTLARHEFWLWLGHYWLLWILLTTMTCSSHILFMFSDL